MPRPLTRNCALLYLPPFGQVRKARASVAAAFTDAAGGWTLARATDDVLAVGGDDDDAGAAWAVALENAAKAQVWPQGGMRACDWLSPPAAPPPYCAAQVRHLLGVAEAWGSVLPRTVFLRAVGAIAGPALRATAAVALSARHLAGAGLHVLVMVLGTQLRGTASALERWTVDDDAAFAASPGVGAEAGGAGVGTGEQSLAECFVPGWSRATSVADILDAPLATIRIRVEARSFALAPAELSRLLYALFSASPARSSILRLLEQQAAADAAVVVPSGRDVSSSAAHGGGGHVRAPPARPK